MSATQRARSGVPLDKRSLVVTVPGLPWWGVILLAAGVTFIGVLIDASGGGGELTSAFSTFYFLGCLFAVVAAANNSLFTAMAQPPLLLLVAVPMAQTLIGKENSTALRDIAINVAIPLVDRFPIMLTATVVVLIIGGFRYFLLQQRPSPVRSTRGRRVSPSTSGSRSPAGLSGESAADSPARRRRSPEPSRVPASAGGVDAPPRRRSTERPAGTERPVVAERPAYRPTSPRDGEYVTVKSHERPLSDRPVSDRTPPRRGSAPVDSGHRSTPVDTGYYQGRNRPQPVSDGLTSDTVPRPSEARMEPFFASGAGDTQSPIPPRLRPTGVDRPAYPAPRVRYRDRDETPS